MPQKELKNPGVIRFTAPLLSGGGGAFVEFPFDTEQMFGTTGWIRVAAAIDGEPYRGSLARMGGEHHILIVLKSIRAKIGKQPGDTVEVVLELDTKPREVIVPPDFQACLDTAPDASTFFEELSYSNRRDYVLWIESAKRTATRQNRIEKAVALLSESKKLK